MMLGQFLATYNSSDSYLVADSPRGLGRDLALPPLLACRSRVPYLTAFYVWMSAGNTKSKVHYDESDNCLCQIDGTKRAALWNAAQKMTMESERTWWRSAPDDGHVDARYLEWADVDVDDVGAPGFFEMPWWEATLHAGDCLFIPVGWYHHVRALPGRNLGYSLMWSRDDTAPSCESLLDAGAAPLRSPPLVAASSCSWTYEAPSELVTPPMPADPARLSRCEAAFGPPAPATLDAVSQGAMLVLAAPADLAAELEIMGERAARWHEPAVLAAAIERLLVPVSDGAAVGLGGGASHTTSADDDDPSLGWSSVLAVAATIAAVAAATGGAAASPLAAWRVAVAAPMRHLTTAPPCVPRPRTWRCVPVLRSGLGLLLAWDALLSVRGSPVAAEPIVALLATAEAAAGAALLACLPGAPVLALAGACINLAVCNRCQAAGMSGDTLLRWAALLAAVAPCPLGKLCAVLQVALLYAGAVWHKDVTAYLLEGHAARTVILTEQNDSRDSALWHAATALASSATLGPWVSRLAWLCQVAAAAAALGSVLCASLAAAALCGSRPPSHAVRRRARGAGLAGLRVINVRVLQPCLLAATAFQLGIACTLALAFMPWAVMLLHAAAVLASRELELELEAEIEREMQREMQRETQGETRVEQHGGQRARSGARAMAGKAEPPSDGGGPDEPQRPTGACVHVRASSALVLALMLCLWVADRVLPHGTARALEARVGMHQQWDLFSCRAEAPAVAGRVAVLVTTAEGAEAHAITGTSTGRMLTDRGAAADVFARPPAAAERAAPGPLGGYSSARWRLFWLRILISAPHSAAARAAAEMACAASCTAWREAGRRPEARPLRVRLFNVIYDLPRVHGAAPFVASLAGNWPRDGPRRRAPNVTFSPARAEWGDWPRATAAVKMAGAECGGCPAEPGAHEAAAVAVAAARAGRATHAAWISPPGESRAVDMPTGDVLIFEDDGGEAPAGAPRR